LIGAFWGDKRDHTIMFRCLGVFTVRLAMAC
jgi:hypothetical protein